MPAASTDATPRFDASAGAALLHWYEAERRDLPWRRTTDPYRILVSEIMLQQTRVETVIPRYARFLERFPDLTTLASASPDEVLAEWSGLGYYRRARSLHTAASAIVHEHSGKFPSQYGPLRALPGIGAYTAAAVAAIRSASRTWALMATSIECCAATSASPSHRHGRQFAVN